MDEDVLVEGVGLGGLEWAGQATCLVSARVGVGDGEGQRDVLNDTVNHRLGHVSTRICNDKE